MNVSNLNQKIKLNFGPSGRAVSQEFENVLLDNLLQHLTMERNANVQYLAMSLWFKERDLNGFSHFFLKESEDELMHAYKFADYLIARGQNVSLDELPAPIQKWSSIEELVSYSFNMETDLTASIQQLYAISERTSDVRTNVFLDPIIESQIKSEDQFAHILGKVKFSNDNPSAILLVDKSLSKK
tara:strand:- start:8363 stop:8917 length:555 start_codon:yes stop_codon:yes gene_type:complete